MTMHFKYGFTHKGFKFGWYNKELYRLPVKHKSRSYALKKLNPIQVGNTGGYHVKREKISMKQLELKTTEIDIKINILKHKDLPFN